MEGKENNIKHEKEVNLWDNLLANLDDDVEELEDPAEPNSTLFNQLMDSVGENMFSLLDKMSSEGVFAAEDGLYLIPNEFNKGMMDALFGTISNLDKYDEIYERNHDNFEEVDEIEVYMQVVKTTATFKKNITITEAKKVVKKWLCGDEEDDTLVILWAKRVDIADNGDYKLLVSYARIPLLVDVIDGMDPSKINSDDFTTKQIGWDKNAEDIYGFVNKTKFKEDNED